MFIATRGTNTYSGQTAVKQGTLAIASSHSLGDETDVNLSKGATLELCFQGEMEINKLYIDEKSQPAGTYGAENMSKHIKGNGLLKS